MGQCCKKLKIKCTPPSRWLHIFPKDKRHYFMRNGKKCWMDHVQIDCYIPGIKGCGVSVHEGFGPCYKYPVGPQTW